MSTNLTLIEPPADGGAIPVLDLEPVEQDARIRAPLADPRKLSDRDLVDHINELGTGIKDEAERAMGGMRRTVDLAIAAGCCLIEAKRRAGHGKFELWLKEKAPGISQSTACKWMRLSRQMEGVPREQWPSKLTAAYHLVRESVGDARPADAGGGQRPTPRNGHQGDLVSRRLEALECTIRRRMDADEDFAARHSKIKKALGALREAIGLPVATATGEEVAM